MPIVYDKEKGSFKLTDPTEEELKALEQVAVDYITTSIAKAIGMQGLFAGPPPEEGALPQSTMEVQGEGEEVMQYDFHFTNPGEKPKH